VAPEWSRTHLAQRIKIESSRQLYFRKKSGDEAIMKQIFVDQQYNLNRIGDARS
jgi:hypothetical protein